MSGGFQLADAGNDDIDIDSAARSGVKLRPAAERGAAPLCLRCHMERCATIHRQQPLCRSCHIATLTTRFRQTVKRQCGVQPASRVAVGWSGGLSSSVLCELMRDGTADRSKYRLMLHWDIVHVDCAAIRRPTSDEQRSADDTERSQLLNRFHTIAHILPLSAVFDIPADRQPARTGDHGPFFPSSVQHRSARDEQLRALFRFVQPANHTRLLSALRTHLLSYFCAHGGYSALLTAESATHAATAVISAITRGQGRAAAVHTRMQRWLLGAHWAYPLHDTSHTHIAYMFHYRRMDTLAALGAIDVSGPPQLQTEPHAVARPSASPSVPSVPAVATLDSLSRSFIASLDSLFGHSVANVLRTVAKVDRPELSPSLHCCWCGEALPPQQQFEVALSTQPRSQPQQHVGAEPSELSLSTALHSTATATSTASLLSSSSCYDCLRSFTQPLHHTDLSHCIPDCIRVFDSAAQWHSQPPQQQAEPEAAVATQQSSSDSVLDSSQQPGRRTARHGERSGQAQPQQPRQKQRGEQLRSHIQQFLLDESNEATVLHNGSERYEQH